ncbi:hypothetical protein SDC9_118135 [bioreactor metagenome]|uniref:Uncharacterized protein n=1 Tax=bioreactor metagenome TaxID=1076179 RepID=A0A645C0P1_9ZZZZ
MAGKAAGPCHNAAVLRTKFQGHKRFILRLLQPVAVAVATRNFKLFCNHLYRHPFTGKAGVDCRVDLLLHIIHIAGHCTLARLCKNRMVLIFRCGVGVYIRNIHCLGGQLVPLCCPCPDAVGKLPVQPNQFYCHPQHPATIYLQCQRGCPKLVHNTRCLLGADCVTHQIAGEKTAARRNGGAGRTYFCHCHTSPF